jgi:hypothetical protein
MDEKQLRMAFRLQELQRRSARRQILLNELELSAEPLSSDAQEAHKMAVKALCKAEQAYRKEISAEVGYWRRLWAAVCGRTA